MSDWPWAVTWAVVAIAAAATLIADKAFTAKDCRIGPDLERACLLAAGNARAHASWLDSPRREAGLLLMGSDAAWAPVCARDRGAGAELRSQIDAALGQPDAPGAAALAAQLVVLLENR